MVLELVALRVFVTRLQKTERKNLKHSAEYPKLSGFPQIIRFFSLLVVKNLDNPANKS